MILIIIIIIIIIIIKNIITHSVLMKWLFFLL